MLDIEMVKQFYAAYSSKISTVRETLKRPLTYAEKILWIIENCDLEVLATQMRDRVREKFAFSVVNQRIADEMRSA